MWNNFLLLKKTENIIHPILLMLLLALLSPFNPAHAQDLIPEKIRIYTVADGLPSNNILCMDMDNDNNLWIGTSKGASKFDGKQFINFGAEQDFTDNKVSAILCDRKGNIWCGTGGDGLYKYNCKSKKWTNYNKKNSELTSNDFSIGFLFEDRQGNIWGGGARLNLFKYNGQKLQTTSLESGKDMVQDKAGNLYVINDRDSCLYMKPNNERYFKILHKNLPNPKDLYIDKKEVIWIVTNDYLAKSTDLGKTFKKIKYDKEPGFGWKMLVANDNQIWIAHGLYIVRFDGTKFHYYNEEHGLPEFYYHCIFEDHQGHLWFGSTSSFKNNGLAKFDIVSPRTKSPVNLPELVQSQNFSFQFGGDDGKFGTSTHELIYDYKQAEGEHWIRAENGLVYLDSLVTNAEYKIDLRVTDEFGNHSKKMIALKSDIDLSIPTVRILNRDDFLKPVDRLVLNFHFMGEDDRTPPDKLQFSYLLAKDSTIIENWTNYDIRTLASYKDLRSGHYTFCVKTKDELGNVSEINHLQFEIESSVDKPKIAIKHFNELYFIEENNRPIFKQKPVEGIINSGRISFSIISIDPRPQKQNLQYSVLLEPKMRGAWTLYRSKNYYEFKDLQNGNHRLKVRARDKSGFVSVPIDTSFIVESFDNYPQTKLPYDKTYGRGKIVDKVVNFFTEKTSNSCQYSFKLDSLEWLPFRMSNHFQRSGLHSGVHTIKVLAKNEFGIDPSPASHKFDYDPIADLPCVRLESIIPEVIDTNSVCFRFTGEDDKSYGDRTPDDSIRFSYRLIPRHSEWSSLTFKNEVTFNDLKNGPYLFQVKAIDKSYNESVMPAERFFTIKVIPLYHKKWFFVTISVFFVILATVLATYLTRKRVKEKIYERRYNPYIVGEAVHDPEMFFGRKTMLQDIFQSLQGNSLYLRGERRIGKTSILEHINKNTEKPFFSFFCNLESVKPEFFFSRIMQHLINKIQSIWQDFSPELVIFKKERQKYDALDFEDDIKTIHQFLIENYDPKAKIIMCLDEINATQNFPPDIHQSLRNIFQTYEGNIRMVAAGVDIKNIDWHLPTSPWYNFLEFKNIPGLKKHDAELLIIKPVEGFYVYDQKSVNFILKKTDSKPFFIQKICKTTIEKILNEKHHKVTLKDVEMIYEELIHTDLNREFEIFWETLSVELQKLIISIISGKKPRIYKKHKKELLTSDYNHGHRVIQTNHKELKFSTVFKDWLEINYLQTK